jgi:hypothetical protein
MQAAEDAQEHFLRDIFRVVPMVKQTNAQPEDLGLESFDQEPNGVGLTEQAALHQSGFVRHASSLLLRLQEGYTQMGSEGFTG